MHTLEYVKMSVFTSNFVNTAIENTYVIVYWIREAFKVTAV